MLSQIKALLRGHPWQDKIQYFDTLDSTNSYAKILAAQGAPEGTIVIADQQTGGRGRLGRSFSSPPGMGVYLSVILRPGCSAEELMHLTCAAGVAAVRAIGKPKVGIKWTNDLVIGKRKLGGILTELSVDHDTRLVDWAVVGIGINCCQHKWQFPAEIRDIACSLGMDWQDTPPLIADLIQELYSMNQHLLTSKADIMAQYRDRCITVGQRISVVRGDIVRHGKAVCIEDDGALKVCFDDGSIESVASGEVSIRGMYGYV